MEPVRIVVLAILLIVGASTALDPLASSRELVASFASVTVGVRFIFAAPGWTFAFGVAAGAGEVVRIAP